MGTPLTDHVTLEEMTRTKPGIPNDPPQALAGNILRTAEMVEAARAIWGVPVRISYGYRGPALNRSVGSSDRSAHLLGLAADLTPQGLDLRAAFDALVAHPTYMAGVDQLILERGCVHVGLPIPAHDNIPRHELRLDAGPADHRTYPLYGIWTPEGVRRA